MAETIGGFAVRNTSDLINADTKLCMLVFAAGGMGKTTLAAALDKITQKYESGKRTLIIAIEDGEGGGTMSIQDLGVPFISRPTINNISDFRKLLAALATDTTYGGIILDSSTEYVNKFVKPYALSFASRENSPTRGAGVPERSDYQTMGEVARQDFQSLINLTMHPNITVRKHLIVTALEKEKTSKDGKDVLAIQADLPGALAGASTAMFQTVATIKIEPRLIKNAAGQPIRTNCRVLVTDADGILKVKDRTKIFPKSADANLLELFEKYWLPRVGKTAIAA